MKTKKIQLIMVQIDEAHSSGWPIGNEHQPQPQASFAERLLRVQEFKSTLPSHVFTTYGVQIFADLWNNVFANTLRAWPDVYYCINDKLEIVATSTYGRVADALLDVDCLQVIERL